MYLEEMKMKQLTKLMEEMKLTVDTGAVMKV